MSVLEVQDLTMRYRTRQGDVQAVEGVSFTLERGQSLGLVGESGCGKTSIALSLLKTLPENARIAGGSIRLDGTDLVPLTERQMQEIRWKRISMVFQGAMSSLNPVYRVGDQVLEAIQAHERLTTAEGQERIAELFRMVGLEPGLTQRYPHELSGGMKQRAVIAMAMACKPDVVIADEPTTALDVIVQDRVLRELEKAQRETGTAMLYISHDVAVIAEVCQRIGVMYAGKLVELAPAEGLFDRTVHPYSAALMAAFPSIHGGKRELSSLPGEPPDLLNPPAGCHFHPRCPYATERCRSEEPPMTERRPGHWAACWNPLTEGQKP